MTNWWTKCERIRGVKIPKPKIETHGRAILLAVCVAGLSAVASCSTSTGAEPPGAAVENNDPILIGAGDIAWCRSRYHIATATLVESAISQVATAVVFTTGDNAYELGSQSEFEDCYQHTWGRFKEKTRPSAGNHEFMTPGASGYFGYFGKAAGNSDEGYYSFDLGDWHVAVLNSNCSEVGGCGEGSPQEQWLRRDLARNPTLCTAAYFHHPLFSSRERGGSSDVKPLWQALYDFGAEIVLNGHDHFYERFAPLDPNGDLDPIRGIREFIVGTGGKNLHDDIQIATGSEVIATDTYGVLKLSLSTGSYEWEFISVPGIFPLPGISDTFTDSGSDSCH